MRSDGFDRMDVSTSIPDDPKFRRLTRRHPDLYAPAITAYVGLLATSWREGERLPLEEGWPPLLPFDQAVADAMQEVDLVDVETRIPDRVWAAWYGAAAERRRTGRERQRRADVKRGRVRSVDASQSVQTGPTDSQAVRQAGPSPDQHGSNAGPTSGPPAMRVPRPNGPQAVASGNRAALATQRNLEALRSVPAPEKPYEELMVDAGFRGKR